MADHPSPPPAGDHHPPDFRWQSFFQRSDEPLFLLNRSHRVLFVNRAWERLTGVSAAEARGLACSRRASAEGDGPGSLGPLLCPPPEVLAGRAGRSRRPAPGGQGRRWWDLDFFPLTRDGRLLGVLGRVRATGPAGPPGRTPLPEKLLALRQRVAAAFTPDAIPDELPGMRRAVNQIRLAGRVSAPVLLLGERGTGKKWLARTIHLLGDTREGPFIALDCARLPARAVASLLTGGGRSVARGGTLYLREPQCLPRDTQQVVAERAADGTAPGPRLIAGTAEDPAEHVRSGRLLDELHSALATLPITVPPLRERMAELPWLVARMLDRVRATGADEPELTPDAWEVVLSYRWPGNLAELFAVVRGANYCASGLIDAAHLPAYLRRAVALDATAAAAPPRPLRLDHLLEQVERRLIELALRRSGGNKSQAADGLAIWRARLLRRMEALGLAEPAAGDAAVAPTPSAGPQAGAGPTSSSDR
jgi:transcriptional regulator with AAA-type ATPase domain